MKRVVESIEPNTLAISEFISLCIEEFKMRHKLSGSQVANIFKDNLVIDFLRDSYDMLHTQSLIYILSEIEIFLSNRGVKL